MERILDFYCRILKATIAACLAVMVVLVFGNVVLRYVFNSGITMSEELSRWLMVWLTFLGADRCASRARTPRRRHPGPRIAGNGQAHLLRPELRPDALR